MLVSYKPFPIIISSPSGAGKTTLCKMLSDNDPNIELSISVTTRKRRPQEIDGKDYHFVQDDEFQKMVSNNDFLEYATVFDHNYGSLKSYSNQILSNGNSVLFDIDWQGARQIKENFKDSASIVSIFILPPSLEELEKRLRSRAQDPAEIVKSRMMRAIDEMSHFDEYDYVVINNNLEETYGRIASIIETKRIKSQDKQELAKKAQISFF